MTSPFFAKRLGARASSGPQFPQRRTLRKARGGRIKRELPGYFLGGLFGGSSGGGGTTSSYSTGNTNNNIADSNYNTLRQTVLGNANTMTIDALTNGFKPYGGPGVVGQTPDQLQAAQQVRMNQGNWSPFFNQASSELNQSLGYDPGRGQTFVDQAGANPTGTQAASPYMQFGAQKLPDAINAYLNPYNDAVTNRIADLGARNLNEKLLPGINDTFTGGAAAQFGRERHADIAGRALRDTQESVLGQQSQVLQQGYKDSAAMFDADRDAALQGAQLAGAQQTADTQTRAGLGQTTAGIQGQAAQTGINQSNAALGLGQGVQNLAGKDAAALQAVGDSAQQNAQNKETFDYQQYMAQNPFQNPWQALQAGQSLAQGWQLPTSSNFTNSGTQTTPQQSGSPFGQILGAGMSAASLFTPSGAGGTSAGGNILGSIFGGGSAAGSGVQIRDGGYLKFGVGGMVPTIAQMRKRTMPQGGPPGVPGGPPTGMPGMPPMPMPNPMPQQPNGQMQSPFARGGQVPRFAAGGSAGGMPWTSIINSGVNLGKHIAGGPDQMEMQPDTPYDPASQIWNAIDPDRPDLNQAQLIGGDIGEGVGSVVGSFFGPFAPAFTEGFGRAGRGIGAAVSGKPIGEVAESFLEGTPLDFLFGDGGHVRRRRRLPEDFKVRRGPFEIKFAEGGYADSPFLRSSEGLGDRLARPRPFDVSRDEYSDMSVPTGRDAEFRNDPLAYMWRRYVPESLRDAGEFVRDIMPDRSISNALDASGRGMRHLFGGQPVEAGGDTAEAATSLMSLLVPGAGKFAQHTARELAPRLMRMVR